MTLIYWEWHLIPRWPLRSIFTRFRKQLFKDGILMKSWRLCHEISLVGRCSWGFLLPVSEYCSAVWSSAADTHHKLLDRVVSGARFLTGGVFECDMLIVDLCQYCVCCIRSGGLVSASYMRECTMGYTTIHVATLHPSIHVATENT